MLYTFLKLGAPSTTSKSLCNLKFIKMGLKSYTSCRDNFDIAIYIASNIRENKIAIKQFIVTHTCVYFQNGHILVHKFS